MPLTLKELESLEDGSVVWLTTRTGAPETGSIVIASEIQDHRGVMVKLGDGKHVSGSTYELFESRTEAVLHEANRGSHPT